MVLTLLINLTVRRHHRPSLHSANCPSWKLICCTADRICYRTPAWITTVGRMPNRNGLSVQELSRCTIPVPYTPNSRSCAWIIVNGPCIHRRRCICIHGDIFRICRQFAFVYRHGIRSWNHPVSRGRSGRGSRCPVLGTAIGKANRVRVS